MNKELLKIAGNLLRQAEQIKCLLSPKKEENKKEMYPMSEPQFAQIDCRVTNCKYYKGAGVCSNIAPAITLNENKFFVCWSKVEVKKGSGKNKTKNE